MKLIAVVVASVLASLATTLGLGAALMHMRAPTSTDAPQCAAPAQMLVRRELIFGTARAKGAPIGEGEWQSFLDAIVTPRFPNGFTVLNAYGQWRGEGGLMKEHSRVLVIWHDRAPQRGTDIETIRSAYKTQFDQESVMRIDGMSCVSF